MNLYIIKTKQNVFEHPVFIEMTASLRREWLPEKLYNMYEPKII